MREQAIRDFMSLESGTALVVATDTTSCTELILSSELETLEDFKAYKEAIDVLLNKPLLHTRVLDVGAKYITVEGKIIPLAEYTTHVVDSDF